MYTESQSGSTVFCGLFGYGGARDPILERRIKLIIIN
jgi:hypothetical protein